MNLSYKPHFQLVVDRHKHFWNREMPHQILAKIDIEGINTMDAVARVLSRCPVRKAMLEAWIEHFEARRLLEDDAFPVARVSYGSFAYGMYFGADVQWTESGGWAKPVLASWDDIDKISYDAERYWIKEHLATVAYFSEQAKGKFAVAPTETIDALNLAEALRGTSAYTDIYDYPDKLRQLMEYGVDFNIAFLEAQRSFIEGYCSGFFDISESWLPGKTIWISLDSYCNCQPDVFQNLGKEYIQELIHYFGGGWIHLHSSGLHLLAEVTTMDHIVGIQIFDDPGIPGFEHMEEIRALTQEIPIQLFCTADQLLEGIKTKSLPTNVMYRVTEGVKDVNQANTIMERVRDYYV